jgi:flagellar biosynthesis GTPase FlhF
MDIRTYRAESVHDALQLVRHELGPNAIVLRSREVRAGGLIGFIRGTRCMELTASVDLPVVGPWLRPLGPLDQGIDLSGPVAFRLRSAANDEVTSPATECRQNKFSSSSQVDRFDRNPKES